MLRIGVFVSCAPQVAVLIGQYVADLEPYVLLLQQRKQVFGRVGVVLAGWRKNVAAEMRENELNVREAFNDVPDLFQRPQVVGARREASHQLPRQGQLGELSPERIKRLVVERLSLGNAAVQGPRPHIGDGLLYLL